MNRTKTLLCLGHCQGSAIPHESLVEVELCDPQTLVPGDIALFCSRGVSACHRVLYRKRFGDLIWYYLKADRAVAPDGWIPAYRVEGRAVRVNGAAVPSPRSLTGLWRLLSGRFWNAIHEGLFASPLGRALGRWREKALPSPILFPALRALSASR